MSKTIRNLDLNEAMAIIIEELKGISAELVSLNSNINQDIEAENERYIQSMSNNFIVED